MSGDLGRWRALHVSIWRHPMFRALHSDAQRFTFYLLTGPQTNRIGFYSFSTAAAAEDISVSTSAAKRRLDEVCKAFAWRYDTDGRAVLIPSHFRFNHPQNPSHLKSMLADLSEVGSMTLLPDFVEAATRHLSSDGLRAVLHELTASRLPGSLGTRGGVPVGGRGATRPRTRVHTGVAHQDQDQDQDQQQDQDQELNQDQNDPAAATAIRAMWDRRPPSFAAAAAPVSRIHGTVFEGALPRDHRDHAACAPNLSWCVPSAVHQKLVTAYLPKVGGERAKADRTLLEWYVVVWANLPADTVIGDAFRFWTPRFEAQFGTTQAPPTARPGEQRSAVPGVEATREYMRRLKEQAQ